MTAIVDKSIRSYDAPVAEVSGVCFAGERVVIVGDAKPQVAWAPWTDDGPGAWQVLDVAKLSGAPKKTGQFEAVEHLGGDVVAILCEEPARVVAIDLRAAQVVTVWHLEVELKSLKKHWRKDDNSLGEGMFFGPDRLFVIKEKDPAAIIEFGTSGQSSLGEYRTGTWPAPGAQAGADALSAGEVHTLTALAWWELPDYGDVSDACVVEGVIWLLSDQDRCFGPVGDDTISLPKRIDKPEGLTRTPQGQWLVAVDNPDGKNSLFVLSLSN